MPARQDLTASQLSRGTLGKSENEIKNAKIFQENFNPNNHASHFPGTFFGGGENK